VPTSWRKQRQLEELNQRILHDRAYNEARRRLPVCSPCCSNTGSTVKEHTTLSSSCLYYTNVNPFQRYATRIASEMITAEATFIADAMHGNLLELIPTFL
jgi:hypothetical protein